MQPKRQHRAAIYLRVSLDATGQQLAVSRQREDCLKIIRDRGWAVTQEYVDNSLSASDRRRKRPAYDRMAADFAAGHFDALVCWDLDRLTRQPRQLEDWIDAATDRGLRLVTANGEADLTTDAGRLFARIKASVARSEVERKAARQTRANRQRAEQGLPPSGVRLTGYATDGQIVPDEADTVRRMFAEFVDGRSLRAISDGLVRDGVAARRGIWNPSSVRTILTNPRYAGQAIYQGQPISAEPTWPAIVEADTFSLVQAIIRDPRRRTQRSTERRHLGSGVYRCGLCGRVVRSWSGGRYRCPDGCVTRSGSTIDDLVAEYARQRLSLPDISQILRDPADGSEAEDLAAEAGRLHTRLRTIGEDYDDGVIDGHRYREAREKVSARLREVEQRQAVLAGATTGPASVLHAPSPADAFDLAPLTTRQAVVSVLMDVRLLPAPRGSRTFDPASVVVEWHA